MPAHIVPFVRAVALRNAPTRSALLGRPYYPRPLLLSGGSAKKPYEDIWASKTYSLYLLGRELPKDTMGHMWRPDWGGGDPPFPRAGGGVPPRPWPRTGWEEKLGWIVPRSEGHPRFLGSSHCQGCIAPERPHPVAHTTKQGTLSLGSGPSQPPSQPSARPQPWGSAPGAPRARASPLSPQSGRTLPPVLPPPGRGTPQPARPTL